MIKSGRIISLMNDLYQYENVSLCDLTIYIIFLYSFIYIYILVNINKIYIYVYVEQIVQNNIKI